MKNVMVQTSDPERYAPLLDLTMQVNRAFASRFGIDYERYSGVKRGFFPWHAAFNRIILLDEYQKHADLDWFLYVDADAYVYNMDYDIISYLRKHSDFALVIGQGSVKGKWDVNTGVFFMNLKHPVSREIIQKWKNLFYADLPDTVLASMEEPFIGQHDQSLLQKLFRLEGKLLDSVYVEDRNVINTSKASFIRQVVRTSVDTLDTRIERARADIAKVLQKESTTS